MVTKTVFRAEGTDTAPTAPSIYKSFVIVAKIDVSYDACCKAVGDEIEASGSFMQGYKNVEQNFNIRKIYVCALRKKLWLYLDLTETGLLYIEHALERLNFKEEFLRRAFRDGHAI